MIIRTTSKFRRAYQRRPKAVKKKAKEKERLFREKPFDLKLDTHKLHGKYKHYWAFPVTG